MATQCEIGLCHVAVDDETNSLVRFMQQIALFVHTTTMSRWEFRYSVPGN